MIITILLYINNNDNNSTKSNNYLLIFNVNYYFLLGDAFHSIAIIVCCCHKGTSTMAALVKLDGFAKHDFAAAWRLLFDHNLPTLFALVWPMLYRAVTYQLSKNCHFL